MLIISDSTGNYTQYRPVRQQIEPKRKQLLDLNVLADIAPSSKSIRRPLEDSTSMTDSLRDLAQQLDQFAKDRDWQQFHSPKNLVSALVVETGELLEHFQWRTEKQSRTLAPEKRDDIEMRNIRYSRVSAASASTSSII